MLMFELFLILRLSVILAGYFQLVRVVTGETGEVVSKYWLDVIVLWSGDGDVYPR